MFILDIIGIVTCFFTVSIYSISTGSNIETTMFNACASSLVYIVLIIIRDIRDVYK